LLVLRNDIRNTKSESGPSLATVRNISSRSLQGACLCQHGRQEAEAISMKYWIFNVLFGVKTIFLLFSLVSGESRSV